MKFRKRPVVIEAEQFWPAVTPWPAGVQQALSHHPTGYTIETLEGLYTVTPGDWIITGVKGERYPCKPDIFKASYERVEEEER